MKETTSPLTGGTLRRPPHPRQPVRRLQGAPRALAGPLRGDALPPRPPDRRGQELASDCLTELRLLASARFDAESLLFTLLCGDQRLPERFRTPELLPLGSRIRARLTLGPLAPEDLQTYLAFSLDQAGAPQLLAPELIQTLVTHAAGNLRVLTHMAAELLVVAAERNLPRLD